MIIQLVIQFCQKYWKQIAAIATVLIIFAFGYYRGYQHEKIKYEAFVSQIEANAKIQEAHNSEILKNQEKITTNVVKGYSNAIDQVNSYYSNRIGRMQNNRTASSMPKTSNATGTINANAANIQDNAPRIETTIIPQECVEDSINLFYLQKWITEQVNND